MPNASPALAAKLVLSDDATVEALLTDIPLFCVGILAFGLSTFFLFMKRFNLLALYIFSSALLAFGSAILDLSQVLARSRDEEVIGQDGVNAIVNTREVGLSLALFFRYLFYWTFISERPRGEPPPPRNTSGNHSHWHSADWRRWGYIGFALRWTLLAGTISIPILEMIWRLAVRRYDTVYMVSATIQIVSSSLFVLKLFLNIFLTPVSPWWRLLRYYLVPFTALLLNIGVTGIGNLISFAFSETTLGRFFQSIELYLLMLFILISTFYKQRPNSAVKLADSSPYDDKKDPETILLNGSQSKAGPGFILATPARPFDLRASRSSSWIFGRGLAARRSVSQGWGRGDIEAVPVQTDHDEKVDADDASEVSFQIQPPSEHEKKSSSTRPLTAASASLSYYQMDQSRLSFPTAIMMAGASRNGSDSPVYGLNGIVNREPDSVRSSKQSLNPVRASMSSFDELLRQQGELDKSIATLRLFSPQPSEPAPAVSKPPVPQNPVKPSRGASVSTNSWAARGLDSASARSEFSLSIFPEPPTVPALNTGDNNIIRGGLEEFPSSPYQPTRFASNGTQYDVTSFIGDLTVPIDEQGRPLSTLKRAEKVESDGIGLASFTSPPPLAPATASSGLLTSTQSRQSRRFSTAPAVSSPLANPFHPRNPASVPVGPRGPVRARSSSIPNTRTNNKPKLTGARGNISGPLQASDSREAPGAFEKPRRPPPLLLGQPEKSTS